ncbi:MAG: hypothetical protein ACTHL7_05255 [Steroidobacteraceae bacterium]
MTNYIKREKLVNPHSRPLAIAMTLTTALGISAISYAGKPPPPPPEPYNPQITYFTGQGGNSTYNLNVTNADGTDLVSLLTTPSKTVVWGLKFAPTGNRIVFIENHSINVLTYAVSAQGVTTTSVKTLTTQPYNVLHVDVSPDGTELVFVEDTANPNLSAVYVMSMSGGQPTQITGLPPDVYTDAVWTRSNTRIAVIQGCSCDQTAGKTETIQTADLDPTNYSVINLQPLLTNTASNLYQIYRLESAHTVDSLLFTATPTGSPTGIYKIDIGTQSVTPVISPGDDASYSADDSMIVFRGYDGTGNLFTLNVSTNVVIQLTSKVNLGAPDFLP